MERDAPSKEDGLLSGIRVLDPTHWYSGPYATLLLSGLGAEILRIADPVVGDPVAGAPPFVGTEGIAFSKQTDADLGLAYLKRNRGKKSITLSLRSNEGRALFFQLVQRADVVIENFRPGVAERLGIDYATLSALNPAIVYCAITGYCATGPDRNLKAYDTMVQAASGLMSITGEQWPATQGGFSVVRWHCRHIRDIRNSCRSFASSQRWQGPICRCFYG